jgi:hypothetical protein
MIAEALIDSDHSRHAAPRKPPAQPMQAFPPATDYTCSLAHHSVPHAPLVMPDLQCGRSPHAPLGQGAGCPVPLPGLQGGELYCTLPPLSPTHHPAPHCCSTPPPLPPPSTLSTKHHSAPPAPYKRRTLSPLNTSPRCRALVVQSLVMPWSKQ